MLVPITYDLARGARANSVLSIVLTIGAASAFYGIVQYAVLNFDGLGRRPQGTLSHWMTYSGTLMLVICAATARLLYGSSGRLWAAFVMPALLVALSLTLTRGAWVGVAVGVAVLLAQQGLPPARADPVVVVIAGCCSRRRPSPIAVVFDLRSATISTSRDRIAMLEAGVAIVKDYPLMGVGPDQIERVYPRYRVPDAVKPTNPHLHNVPMQIAAERGLPALGAWIWFVVSVFVRPAAAWSGKRATRASPPRRSAAMAAMLAAGLTEYNFGDSEFLMLLLVIITLPFAANRDGGLPS